MGAVREGGAIHTEGEWFAGGGSWVSADQPIDGEIGGSDNVEYYGGHLIGESISSCNIPIISAAPDMFKALLAVKQKLHLAGLHVRAICGLPSFIEEIELIEAALIKAVTRVPVPEKVVPVGPVAAPENDPDFVGAGYRLIGADEVFIAGDQFDENTGLPKPLWLEVESNIGRLKRDSTIANNRCRRKVEPADQDSVGVGYRIVGQDETLIAGDEYWNKIGDYWEQVYSERGKQKQCSSLSLYRVRRSIVNDGELVDAEFKVLGQQKPLLSLMPRQEWLENRRDDIYDAIARYRDAGKDVKRDWLNELIRLDDEMRSFDMRRPF